MNDEMPSFEEVQDMDDRTILIMVVQKLRSVGINQCNHLKHHEQSDRLKWKFILLCTGIFLTGLINMSLGLFLIAFRG